MSHVSDPVEWFAAPNKRAFYPRPDRDSGSGMNPESHEHSLIFKTVSKAAKVIKISPKVTQTHEKTDPEIMRNPISAKVDFCNTFNAKCMFFQSQTPEFRPKNQQKKQPGNRYEKNCFLIQKYLKNFQNGSLKSTKNQ